MSNTHGTTMRDLLLQVQERTTVGPKVKMSEQDPSLTDPRATGDEPDLLKGLIKKPKKKDKGDGEILINPTVEGALRAQDREMGTDSLVQAYMQDTPGQGQEVEEDYEDDDGWYTHREIHGKAGISKEDWKEGWRLNSKGERVKLAKEERDSKAHERAAADYQQRQGMHVDARQLTRKEFVRKYHADAQAGDFHDAVRTGSGRRKPKKAKKERSMTHTEGVQSVVAELSRQTLGRYMAKASDARGHRKLPTHKIDNRYAGVAKADKLINKDERKAMAQAQAHTEDVSEIKTPRGEKELPRQMKDPQKEMMVFHPRTGVKVIDRDKWEYHRKKGFHPAEEYEHDGVVINESAFVHIVEKAAEDIVKGMKKNKDYFDKKYGDRADAVMYATANKLATEHVIDEKSTWYKPWTWGRKDDVDEPGSPNTQQTGKKKKNSDDTKNRAKRFGGRLRNIQQKAKDRANVRASGSARDEMIPKGTDKHAGKDADTVDKDQSKLQKQILKRQADKAAAAKANAVPTPKRKPPPPLQAKTDGGVGDDEAASTSRRSSTTTNTTTTSDTGGGSTVRTSDGKVTVKPGKNDNRTTTTRTRTSIAPGGAHGTGGVGDDEAASTSGAAVPTPKRRPKSIRKTVATVGPNSADQKRDGAKGTAKAATSPETTSPAPAPKQTGGRKKVAATAANTRDYAKTLATQKALIAKGAKIKADGIMGPNTQAAMKQFGGSAAAASGVRKGTGQHGPASRHQPKAPDNRTAATSRAGKGGEKLRQDDGGVKVVDTVKGPSGKTYQIKTGTDPVHKKAGKFKAIDNMEKDKGRAGEGGRPKIDTSHATKGVTLPKGTGGLKKAEPTSVDYHDVAPKAGDTQGTGIPKKITPPPKPKYDWKHGKTDRMGNKLKYPHGYNQKTGKKLKGMEGGLRKIGGIEVDSRDSAYPQPIDDSYDNASGTGYDLSPADKYAEFISKQLKHGIQKGHVK